MLQGSASPGLLHLLGSFHLEQGAPAAAEHYLRAALQLAGARAPGIDLALGPEELNRAHTLNQLGNALLVSYPICYINVYIHTPVYVYCPVTIVAHYSTLYV